MVTLHLLPGLTDETDEIVVSGDLEVFIPPNYPAALPFWVKAKRTYKGSGGLTISQEKELNNMLQELLQRMLPGDEVILQFATEVQDFLTANNKHINQQYTARANSNAPPSSSPPSTFSSLGHAAEQPSKKNNRG
ncbi:MAG: hypothetical protein Q8P67_28765, partial [archaeon]|nr:hypothetical protein [archaeon]